MIKLGCDTNGNKVLKYSTGYGERGFSVQTNGNMPRTHRMTKHDVNEHIAMNELHAHIKAHGTDRQRLVLG